MKKKAFCSLVLLVYMSFCCFAPVQAETAPRPGQFKESVHNQTEEYPAKFNTLSVQNKLFDLNIEQNIYQSESAGELFLQASADVGKLSQTLGEKAQKTELYIVPLTLNGSVQAIGSRVYCTAQDVISGGYRTALMAAVLGTEEPWIAIGLSVNIFGSRGDAAMLADYYSQAESLDILSLFPAYFSDAFTNVMERNIAIATAASLSFYVIEQYGLDELLKSGQSYAQQWLTSLGIKRDYDNPYADSFDGYRYTAAIDYPLVVVSQRGDEFYFKPITGLIETPLQIEQILFEDTQGARAILSYIKEHAPEYYEKINANYSEPIFYYFNEDIALSAADRGRRVYVYNPSLLLHQMVYMMIPPIKGVPIIWPYAALSQYLPAMAYPAQAERARYFNVLTAIFDGDSADDQIARLAQKIYLKNSKMPISPEDVDVLLYTKSIAAAAMLLPALEAESDLLTLTLGEMGNRQFSNQEGSEMTYPQAASFGDYLVKNYGLSSLIRLSLEPGEDFTGVYGVTYDVMKSLWMNEGINKSL